MYNICVRMSIPFSDRSYSLFRYKIHTATIPAKPASDTMIPPNRMETIYMPDGSVASFDFQLSVTLQIIDGLSSIPNPSRTSSTLTTPMHVTPFLHCKKGTPGRYWRHGRP